MSTWEERMAAKADERREARNRLFNKAYTRLPRSEVVDPTPEPYDSAREARYIIIPTLMRHGVWLAPETADTLWEALQPIVAKVVHNSAPVG